MASTLRCVSGGVEAERPRHGHPVGLGKSGDARHCLDGLAREVERPPSSLTITVFGQRVDRDLAHRCFDAGADRVIVWPPTGPPAPDSEDEMGRELERIAGVVLAYARPPLRSAGVLTGLRSRAPASRAATRLRYSGRRSRARSVVQVLLTDC